jgi:hypothetical protein
VITVCSESKQQGARFSQADTRLHWSFQIHPFTGTPRAREKQELLEEIRAKIGGFCKSIAVRPANLSLLAFRKAWGKAVAEFLGTFCLICRHRRDRDR